MATKGAGSKNNAMETSFFSSGREGVAHESAALLVDARDLCVLDANPQALALLGCSRADISGRALSDLIEPCVLEDAGRSAPGADCYRLAGKDDSSRFYAMSAASFSHEGREVALYLLHDVTFWFHLKTDLTNRNLELSHLARHDHLTNLFNRLMFRDTLEMANARLGRTDGWLGLLYVDLDGFKQVNDRLGHDAGDHVLVEIARRLRNSVRTSDVAARLGGDEFGVILENLRAPEDALIVARHIVDRIAEPILVDGETVVVTASVGAAVVDQPLADAASLVASADRMMFEARSGGPGRAALASDINPGRVA